VRTRSENYAAAVAQANQLSARASQSLYLSPTHKELIASIAMALYHQGRLDSLQEFQIESSTRTSRVSGSNSNQLADRPKAESELAGAAQIPPERSSP